MPRSSHTFMVGPSTARASLKLKNFQYLHSKLNDVRIKYVFDKVDAHTEFICTVRPRFVPFLVTRKVAKIEIAYFEVYNVL